MRLQDQKAYPNLRRWLMYGQPRVRRKKRVWDAFLKWSTLGGSWYGEALAGRALSWGVTYPTISVIEMKCRQLGSTKYDKRYAFQVRNEIFLAADIAKEFERRPRDPDMRLLVEATIMHELVHWGRFAMGKDSRKGHGFEEAAYGAFVKRTWSTCNEYETPGLPPNVG